MSDDFEMKATAGGESYEQAPPGPHAAVLVALIDLGTHPSEFEGKSDLRHELYLAWELPGVKMSGSTLNHFIRATYTFSFGEKANLRKMVEGWRGKKFAVDEPFSPAVLLGKPCQLNVTHKETGKKKTIAIVDSVTRLMAGVPAPAPTVQPIAYGMSSILSKVPPPDFGWLPNVWDGGQMVSPGAYVQQSHEWRGLEIPKREAGKSPEPAAAGAPGSGDANDSLPF